jgi:hypothetical protein
VGRVSVGPGEIVSSPSIGSMAIVDRGRVTALGRRRSYAGRV